MAESEFVDDQLVATCPECAERFTAPADAGGALIECTTCPWYGTVAHPDN